MLDLIDLDPTPKKIFRKWLSKMNSFLEIKKKDYHRVQECLSLYHKAQKYFSKSDINQYGSISELFEEYYKLRRKAELEASLIHDSEEYVLREVFSSLALDYYSNFKGFTYKEGKRSFILKLADNRLYVGDSGRGFLNMSGMVVKLSSILEPDSYISKELRILFMTIDPEFEKCFSHRLEESDYIEAIDKGCGEALRYVPFNKRTEVLCLKAVSSNGILLKAVPSHCKTEEVCLSAIRENINSYKYIESPTETVMLNAVCLDGLLLKDMGYQTERICLAAVENNGASLEYVENQTEEICLAAVRQDPSSLQHVKTQTEEICYEAVKRKGYSLFYVENQTEEICLAAVRQEGRALKYVETQTKEICLAAIENHKNAYDYIRDPALLD